MSIVVIEAAILVPSYTNYERDLLVRLEHAGRAAVETAFRGHGQAQERDLLTIGRLLARGSDVRGGSIYRTDGTRLGTFGETPEMSLAEMEAMAHGRWRNGDATRLDVLMPAQETRLPVTIVARLDASWIEPTLVAFVWRIFGLVVLISAFVTGATMIIVGRLVLRPVLKMRAGLVAAGANPTNPSAYALDNTRQDELGQVMAAFNRMSRRIDAQIKERELDKIALAQANNRLEERVRERTEVVRQTRLEVIHRLSRAAEYRDDNTGQHVNRVSQVSAALGRSVGLSEGECDIILNAAPMHDVGKIGIPDHILLKPGRLTPEEWEVMKTHAKIGGDIFSGNESELLQAARAVALTHHEKWDGSGYPDGLKGEAIPLIGRIVAVADVFDALVSKRPYKAPWTFDDALGEIERISGSHFDPHVVRAFLSIFPQVTEIHSRLAN